MPAFYENKGVDRVDNAGVSTFNGGALNLIMGKATMVSGTVTVLCAAIKSTSVVFIAAQSIAGTIGLLSVGVITPGVSFVINSANVLDTSNVGYLVVV